MKREIIAKIRKNQTSTTEILDIFGKDWNFFINIPPLNQGSYAVGEAYVVYIVKESNWYIHIDLLKVPENVIVFIEAGDEKRAAFGSLVSNYLFNKKGVLAVVTEHNLRDGQELKKRNYPIWCRDIVAVGCLNKRSDDRDALHKSIKGNRHRLEGAILVCDDCGIAVIPEEKQTKDFLDKLDFIKNQEEIWFKCVDEGWSTFKTVCLKDYLKEKADETQG